MKNFKRIISFVMAMIIFTSFCCINSSAYFSKVYFADYDSAYGQTNKSFAFLSIDNYGQEDYETDLEVTTQAYNHEFNAGNYNTTVYVYAKAYMMFNNHLVTTVDDAYYAGSDERMARIRVFGRYEMDGEHYLIDVASDHAVVVRSYFVDDNGDRHWTVIYENTAYIDD